MTLGSLFQTGAEAFSAEAVDVTKSFGCSSEAKIIIICLGTQPRSDGPLV